jgi:UDP-2,3-diacylglucosamine pyrophosphatase LpxH
MIIITDAHVSQTRGNHTDFFSMLEAVESTGHDLIFLGDIFDLWIALPRYEESIHKKFIDWCHRQKSSRTIGFLEGNHEFYLTSQQSDAFTWCSCDSWLQNDAGILYVHGDLINRRDKKYLAFKKLIKNDLVKFILRVLPYGPAIAMSVKQRLKKSNNRFRLQIPWNEIKLFADRIFADGVDTIFVGHFHQEYCYGNHESKKLYLLPDWLSSQAVTLYEKDKQRISSMHWKQLLQ